MTRTRIVEPGIGQPEFEGLIPPVVVEPEDTAAALNSDTQVGISKFIRQMSERLAYPPDYTTIEDISLAAPLNIQAGLYVPDRARNVPNSYLGIIFPDNEFLAVAKSPSMLANHAAAKVRKAKTLDPHKDEVEIQALTEARQTLEEFLRKQTNVGEAIDSETTALRAIYLATQAPDKRRFTEQNWNQLRPIADVAIRKAIDVAARFHEWGSSRTTGVKRAVEYEMYGHSGHNNRRIANVRAYTHLVGTYSVARGKAVDVAVKRTQKELDKYKMLTNG